MATEIVSVQAARRPRETDFTALSEHQSSTPAEFFGAKPVLYLHETGCTILVSEHDLQSHGGREFAVLFRNTLNGANGDNLQTTSAPTSSEINDTMKVAKNVQIWICSDNLIVCKDSKSCSEAEEEIGLSIPYPRIALHATQRLDVRASSSGGTSARIAEALQPLFPNAQTVQAVYLQFDVRSDTARQNDKYDDDADGDEIVCSGEVTMLIIPSVNASSSGEDSEKTTEIYNALSECAELHPDPYDDQAEDNDGGGLVGLDGAADFPTSGWITAENAHEFEGQFADDHAATLAAAIPQLGPGAGSRRQRDTSTDENEERENDDEDQGHRVTSESVGKWQRTD